MEILPLSAFENLICLLRVRRYESGDWVNLPALSRPPALESAPGQKVECESVIEQRPCLKRPVQEKPELLPPSIGENQEMACMPVPSLRIPRHLLAIPNVDLRAANDLEWGYLIELHIPPPTLRHNPGVVLKLPNPSAPSDMAALTEAKAEHLKEGSGRPGAGDERNRAWARLLNLMHCGRRFLVIIISPQHEFQPFMIDGCFEHGFDASLYSFRPSASGKGHRH
jgi:hypothetical protein